MTVTATESERLADAIAARLSPPGADETARLVDLLVDAAGMAQIGQPTSLVRKASCAFAGPLPAEHRAYLNGAAIHALDFDDTHEPSLCHTGAAIVPGLLGLAASAHLPGTAVLTAFSAGLRFIDLIAPLGPRLNQRGLHSTGIVGTLGAAVANTVLLGGAPQVASAAVEIAATMAAGLCASFGSEMKPLQAGRAAETGVRAALLASQGVTYPDSALLGPGGLIALLLGAGAADDLEWTAVGEQAVANVAVKAYPSCYLTHSAIGAAAELRGRLGIRSGRDVRSARLTVHPIVTELANKTVAGSELDGKFSVRYCLLAALSSDRVGVGSFSDAGRADILARGPEWADWLSRVEVVADPESPRLRAALDLELTDGQRASVTMEGPKGGIGQPLSRVEVREKFHRNVAPVSGDGQAADLLSRLAAVPETADVAQLGPLLPS